MSKVLAALTKYHWILTLLAIFFLALGFGFKTPQQKFQEIEGDIHALQTQGISTQTELGNAKIERQALKRSIEDFSTIECIKAKRGTIAQQRALEDAQVPCARLLRERGLQ